MMDLQKTRAHAVQKHPKLFPQAQSGHFPQHMLDRVCTRRCAERCCRPAQHTAQDRTAGTGATTTVLWWCAPAARTRVRAANPYAMKYMCGGVSMHV